MDRQGETGSYVIKGQTQEAAGRNNDIDLRKGYDGGFWLVFSITQKESATY